MSDTKEYDNGEVTIVWQPGRCQHSAVCFKGLSSVFDPRRRPWIQLGDVPTKDIVEQVKKCPSGALSFRMNKA